MLALVSAQVDVGDGALEERQHRQLDGSRVAREREDRPVVGRVGGKIEQPRAGHAADRVCHRRNHVGAASLADVGNALNQH